MPIAEEQVSHVARLTRLKLSPEELAKYSRELTQIIDYIDRLAEVNTKGVEIALRFAPLGYLQEDIVGSSLPVEKGLKNVPEKKENYFIVPRVN
jgi:aspartyl-tRNA(Asn)/glutamyl-tRNA(Gln) amidotransferase subunit C